VAFKLAFWDVSVQYTRRSIMTLKLRYAINCLVGGAVVFPSNYITILSYPGNKTFYIPFSNNTSSYNSKLSQRMLRLGS
jgi:hypothetical protein